MFFQSISRRCFHCCWPIETTRNGSHNPTFSSKKNKMSKTNADCSKRMSAKYFSRCSFSTHLSYRLIFCLPILLLLFLLLLLLLSSSMCTYMVLTFKTVPSKTYYAKNQMQTNYNQNGKERRKNGAKSQNQRNELYHKMLNDAIGKMDK